MSDKKSNNKEKIRKEKMKNKEMQEIIAYEMTMMAKYNRELRE